MNHHHYIDFQFNGMGGELISMSLLRADGAYIYFIFNELVVFDRPTMKLTVSDKVIPWVNENVIPHLLTCPAHVQTGSRSDATKLIEEFLSYTRSPHIVADYPDDIAYFCGLLVTGPGTCIQAQHMTFEWLRVEPYPTSLKDAVQYNAWWNTQALVHLITQNQIKETT